MGHRFLSEAWVGEAKRIVNASREFHRVVGGQSASLLATVTETPEGGSRYLYYEFHDGRLTRAEVGPNGDLARRPAQFRVTATYATFARIQRGELSLQAAYFQRKVKLAGDFQRAMRFAPAFLKYAQLVRAVETEF